MLRRLLQTLVRPLPAPVRAAELASRGMAAWAAELASRGMAAWREGDAAGAERDARDALALWPDCHPASTLLASLQLRGPHYLKILERLHRRLKPATYVEIGVSSGMALALAGPETQAIGIDPRPRIQHPLSARTRVFTETSDAFFAGRDLTGELGGRPVDLAFIDGMHRFEFALRDFMNLEQHCRPGATILVHDCYPLDERSATRERHATFWSGDVWRSIVALKRYRPELRIATLAVPPTGLGVIRCLDPASRVLAERYDEVVADVLAMDYAELEPRKAELLSLTEANQENLDRLFA